MDYMGEKIFYLDFGCGEKEIKFFWGIHPAGRMVVMLDEGGDSFSWSADLPDLPEDEDSAAYVLENYSWATNDAAEEVRKVAFLMGENWDGKVALLTAPEFAALHDVTPPTVRGWLQRGLLPQAQQYGKRLWLIPSNTPKPEDRRYVENPIRNRRKNEPR